eukprot:1372848-Karenia_brevis.AAC.1
MLQLSTFLACCDGCVEAEHQALYRVSLSNCATCCHCDTFCIKGIGDAWLVVAIAYILFATVEHRMFKRAFIPCDGIKE